MYQRWAKKNNQQISILEKSSTNRGLRSITLKVKGNKAKLLFNEGGAHRIQHKTRSRRQDRIHTSTATVAIIPVIEKPSNHLNNDEIKIETFRGSGAGGQHRNKTENGIKATHIPTGLAATIDGRSRKQNKIIAIELLASRVKNKINEEHQAQEQSIRSAQTMAERARAVRTYDLIEDNVRCANGKKVSGANKVLKGRLEKIF